MRPLALLAVTLLAAAAKPVPGPSAAFLKETAGHVPGKPQSCVSALPNESLRVLDPMTLAYGLGPTVYINHLPGACPALSPLNTLIVVAQGSQYCRGDRVRGREPGALIAGPSCNLGDWVPYRMSR